MGDSYDRHEETHTEDTGGSGEHITEDLEITVHAGPHQEPPSCAGGSACCKNN